MEALIGLCAVLMPVMIVAMVLLYRFMSRLYFPETRKSSRREAQRGSFLPPQVEEGPSAHELMAKCAEYQKRIQNLEDILRERAR